MNPYGIARPAPIDLRALAEFNAGTAAARAAYREDVYGVAPESRLCSNCGETSVLAARGLCSKCYRRHSRAGTLTNFRRVK